jgi:beta-phosphoglucomutase-like phosphatase (HAD superfamily)
MHVSSEPLEGLTDHYAAFLFDCDGTLVDTMGTHFRAWQETLREHGLRGEIPYGFFHSLGGMSGLEVARTLCAWAGIQADPQQLALEKRARFMAHADHCPEIPLVADFARKVARTHPVAVVSGGHLSAVERSLRAAGLLDLFGVILTPADVARGKPAPDMFLLAAERLGVSPARCLVFEDGAPGIEGAQAAGMRVIVIEPAAALP